MTKKIEHIGDLVPDAENARLHGMRNVGMIVEALHDVGAARSIVIDEDGRILAGNATIDAAAEAGIERVQVVDADGETIIAVRRSGLTKEQKKALAYYDNRTADLADWNTEQIATDIASGFDVNKLWSPYELEDLLQHAGTVEPIDFDAEWQGMPAFENEAGAVRSLIVHFETTNDVNKFAQLTGQVITNKTKSIWFPQRKHQDESSERWLSRES